MRRYHSPVVMQHLQALLEAEETKRQVKRDFFKMTLAKMDSYSAVGLMLLAPPLLSRLMTAVL